jgi:hypothetical protein
MVDFYFNKYKSFFTENSEQVNNIREIHKIAKEQTLQLYLEDHQGTVDLKEIKQLKVKLQILCRGFNQRGI